MSPLAPNAVHSIITITPEALATLVELRDTEPDADGLGLRLEVISGRGEDFRYDLSFDVVTRAATRVRVRPLQIIRITRLNLFKNPFKFYSL